MVRLTLYSNPICPYVQRVRIILLEKNIHEIDVIDIDFKNKPDWFVALAPLAKVPALKVDDAFLFESLVIAEYLEVTYSPKLLPEQPIDVGVQRSWISYCDTLMNAFSKLRRADNTTLFNEQVQRFQQGWLPLIKQLSSHGAYFTGNEFALIDAIYAPLFIWASHFQTHYQYPLFPVHPRLTAWRGAVLERESVSTSKGVGYEAQLTEYMQRLNPSLPAIIAGTVLA